MCLDISNTPFSIDLLSYYSTQVELWQDEREMKWWQGCGRGETSVFGVAVSMDYSCELWYNAGNDYGQGDQYHGFF